MERRAASFKKTNQNPQRSRIDKADAVKKDKRLLSFQSKRMMTSGAAFADESANISLLQERIDAFMVCDI